MPEIPSATVHNTGFCKSARPGNLVLNIGIGPVNTGPTPPSPVTEYKAGSVPAALCSICYLSCNLAQHANSRKQIVPSLHKFRPHHPHYHHTQTLPPPLSPHTDPTTDPTTTTITTHRPHHPHYHHTHTLPATLFITGCLQFDN